MTELWVKKLPIDVHRLVDNKLPEGSKCTGIAMTTLDDGTVEEYVATINGEEVIVQGPAEESADDVAAALVELAPPPPPPPEPAQESAMVEGAEAPMDEPMFGTEGEPQADTEEYEYDDGEDDEKDYFEDHTGDKPKKAKTKKKK